MGMHVFLLYQGLMKKIEEGKKIGESSFTISGDKDVFYPHGTRSVPFTWKVHFLLSETKEGQSVLALARS